MKQFVTRHAVWFVIIVSIADLLIGFLVDLIASLGLPEVILPIFGSLVTMLLPLVLIWRLGWWRSSGFTTTTLNNHLLWIPLLAMLLPLIAYGTVATENRLIVYFLVAMFLTAVGEEALSRGLLLRALLPLGKWIAVLLPAFLFAIGHITQFLFVGMPLSLNLLQIVHNFFFGAMYGAARLRVGSLWPLVIIHTFNNVFYIMAGITGPNAINEPPIPIMIAFWIIEIVYVVVILRKPSVVALSEEAQTDESSNTKVAKPA